MDRLDQGELMCKHWIKVGDRVIILDSPYESLLQYHSTKDERVTTLISDLEYPLVRFNHLHSEEDEWYNIEEIEFKWAGNAPLLNTEET